MNQPEWMDLTMTPATVNTNPGAMIALQNLNKTNMELAQTQNRINTGMKVASAKDNGALFAISQSMRADVRSFGVVVNSLDRSISTLDVGISAAESITDLLGEMKEKALAASDPSITAASRTAYNNDFVALRNQVATIVSNASFNGTNLINGSTTSMRPLANAAGGSMTVTGANLSLGATGAPLALVGATAQVNTRTLAAAMITSLNTAIDNIGAALARLGSQSKALTLHRTFVVKLSDATEAGIGNLVDADMAKESAKLQSLQVKQQLGIQALSIANQAPSHASNFRQMQGTLFGGVSSPAFNVLGASKERRDAAAPGGTGRP
jgi:flagellin